MPEKKFFEIGRRHRVNGVWAEKTAHSYNFDRSDKLLDLAITNSKKEAISARAKLQYIASICRCDIASTAKILLSERLIKDSQAWSALNKVIQYLKESNASGLTFVKLENLFRSLSLLMLHSKIVTIFSHKLYLLYFCLMIALNEKAIHYSNQKWKTVTKSVMASELFALKIGIDSAFGTRDILFDVLGEPIAIDASTESRTVFSSIAK